MSDLTSPIPRKNEKVQIDMKNIGKWIRGLCLAGLAAVAGHAAPAHAADENGFLDARVQRPEARAIAGNWQGKATFNVPTGLNSLFLHDGCPAGTVTVNGGVAPNAAAMTGMVFNPHNSPRLDLDPPGTYTEWSWLFSWPSGALPGSVITVDVFCVSPATPAPAIPIWTSASIAVAFMAAGWYLIRRQRPGLALPA